MATTMIIGGEKLTMPGWLKAKLLKHTVRETSNPQVLSVESGSEQGKTYHVRHDGHVAVSCGCAAVGDCAHRGAANLWLAEKQNELDEAAAVAPLVLGEQFASDLNEHAEDEMRAQQERMRKMAANQAYRDMFPGDYGYCDVA